MNAQYNNQVSLKWIDGNENGEPIGNNQISFWYYYININLKTGYITHVLYTTRKEKS